MLELLVVDGCELEFKDSTHSGNIQILKGSSPITEDLISSTISDTFKSFLGEEADPTTKVNKPIFSAIETSVKSVMVPTPGSLLSEKVKCEGKKAHQNIVFLVSNFTDNSTIIMGTAIGVINPTSEKSKSNNISFNRENDEVTIIVAGLNKNLPTSPITLPSTIKIKDPAQTKVKSE